ncbi:AzlD domain-containing protein [Saccharopolyspora sp. HNM0983]|uniref:AzlD domain-containing protein n=1 Tax=Saccharopolyspora montiporae TaxID=2781240 RepID=A0A929FYD3_9PSEU|nr:AzlD domain-containing protein [Saccharopolyspora sp. HNM0983]MBE9373370.1 AzlD domain-containing protein [Saccharopolyspora sp. HNM0983]
MTPGVLLALAAGTYAMRLAGPLLRGRITVSERTEQLLSVAAVVLLACFVATSAVFESGEPAGWARFGGVALGGVLAWRRAPLVVVVLAAAGATALLRLAGVA